MLRFLTLAGALLLATTLVAQVPFTPLDSNHFTSTLIVPQSPVTYDVLFVGNHDEVYNPGNGQTALAKQNHDFTGLIQIGPNRAWMIVNHEVAHTRNPKLGDGGGQTVFRVTRRNANSPWTVRKSLYNKKFINLDFSVVGGTNINCGGATMRNGRTITAEEFPASSNAQLWANGNGFADTSDYVIPAGNGPYSGKVLKRFQNIGWMVEAVPSSGVVTKKYYAMGRFSHEGGQVMPDGKTVYLTEDFVPGLLYKFVSDKADDFTEGQLYAYKQNSNGIGGTWVEIERDLDSLLNARTVAIRKGATMFSRLEWVVSNKSGTKLWIAETGNDNSNFNAGLALGGTLPSWANRLDTLYGMPADNILSDRYGRVIELNLNTNTMRSFLEGGSSTDGKTHFSNPDGLVFGKIQGKEFLIINEDLINSTFGRMPYAAPGQFYVNEIFVLDLDINNPTVDDLHRLAIGPYGCETTGGVLTKNGDTYFVNIQHPSTSNPFPWNNSTTVAIRGFGNFVQNLVAKDKEITQAIADLNSKYNNIEDAPLAMFPNPATRFVSFNKATDVEVYNTAGQLMLSETNTTRIDISILSPGVYHVRTSSGENLQLVVE